jgi:HEAT repeat protein
MRPSAEHEFGFAKTASAVLWAGLIAAVLISPGCFSPEPPSLTSNDPDRLIPAMKQAADTGDRSAIPYLVKQLDSDDPAVRLYAIDSLKRLTGETRGYRYYDDTVERRPAVARWQQWLATQPSK